MTPAREMGNFTRLKLLATGEPNLVSALRDYETQGEGLILFRGEIYGAEVYRYYDLIDGVVRLMKFKLRLRRMSQTTSWAGEPLFIPPTDVPNLSEHSDGFLYFEFHRKGTIRICHQDGLSSLTVDDLMRKNGIEESSADEPDLYARFFQGAGLLLDCVACELELIHDLVKFCLIKVNQARQFIMNETNSHFSNDDRTQWSLRR